MNLDSDPTSPHFVHYRKNVIFVKFVDDEKPLSRAALGLSFGIEVLIWFFELNSKNTTPNMKM